HRADGSGHHEHGDQRLPPKALWFHRGGQESSSSCGACTRCQRGVAPLARYPPSGCDALCGSTEGASQGGAEGLGSAGAGSSSADSVDAASSPTDPVGAGSSSANSVATCSSAAGSVGAGSSWAGL